jgi:hypothetical protein
MTEFIAHRINSIAELQKLPKNFGAEIDLRPLGNRIILEHDAFFDGVKDDFENYLQHYNHGILILNIKSEGIEFKCLELLQKYNIKNYFFLDCSFPMIVKLSNHGERKIALRFSEFEGLDTIKSMAGKVEWIWVDCFNKLPINQNNYKLLKDSGFKLCLVSPELQNQGDKIAEYKKYLTENGIVFDAICAKNYNLNKWQHSSHLFQDESTAHKADQ